ncbi:heme ABC exporter ATP-binding protein CcmA [Pararhodospirillum photometricum]|uniref:Cytochrome c biogenesis ATP-binding export protein ccmA n=1 Tax=Pararhodospirillum photometricum DSM 122 TaxID=1150469 RepID=H6SJZ7_PARPM|nr:heme ABC exporter ATP-binding protein CcmA [Pararhodospirillum photometricum]CCG08312.1 Cytochrome c biogenesis ATP-binding export protein ccmA [Pararhodospirillum photometricum DSM 122]
MAATIDTPRFAAPAPFAGHGLLCVRGERAVFAALEFRLEPGGALMLVGPNGAGKSSLLRLMALLLRPTAGTLTWDGTDVAEDPEAHGERVRYVGHLDAIKPVLDLRENVAFWARLAGAGETYLDEALATFNLSHLAHLPGRMLSAGQKRRTNLARLIAAPAPLWLLDEPTTALDRASIGLLEGALARHRAQGGMVVLSTHQDIALPGAEILAVDRFMPDLERSGALFWGDAP